MNCKFEGRGLFSGRDTKYFGNWKEDKIHGEGNLMVDDIRIEGIFESGELQDGWFLLEKDEGIKL